MNFSHATTNAEYSDAARRSFCLQTDIWRHLCGAWDLKLFHGRRPMFFHTYCWRCVSIASPPFSQPSPGPWLFLSLCRFPSLVSANEWTRGAVAELLCIFRAVCLWSVWPVPFRGAMWGYFWPWAELSRGPHRIADRRRQWGKRDVFLWGGNQAWFWRRERKQEKRQMTAYVWAWVRRTMRLFVFCWDEER